MNIAKAKFVMLFLVTLGLCLVNFCVAQLPTFRKSMPIANHLNPDGTLKIDASSNRILDVSGYQMILAENDQPRFIPNPPHAEDIRVRTLSAGDENWTGTFTGNGLNQRVWDIGVASDIYPGGTFTATFDGSTTLNKIAKWDGANWSQLGNGATGTVYAVLIWNGNVYIGGSFSTVSGVNAYNIAKWNGSSWSALSTGTDGPVYALAVYGFYLVIGGRFSQAGGNEAKCMAQWDGLDWEEFGGGAWTPNSTATVYTIAVDEDNIYFGGDFYQTWGVVAHNIARWNPADANPGNNYNGWTSLAQGTNAAVRDIEFYDNDLYAGGFFTQAGNATANHIAKWDGTSWSALGDGTSGNVYALGSTSTHLYVGGDFIYAGGITVNNIGYWTGNGWANMGSGTNDIVRTIAIDGDLVYVGGDFLFAGIDAARYIAVWDEPDPIIAKVKVFLEGTYSGGSMTVFSDLPLNSPYSDAPLAVPSIPANVTDWILLEIRNQGGTASIMKKSGFLRDDGMIIDENSNTYLTFEGLSEGDYSLVVRHHNHVDIMSANAVTLSPTTSSAYDFTYTSSQYYGTDGAKELESGVWGMWLGDIDGNGVCSGMDYEIWFDAAKSKNTGYQSADLTFDRKVCTQDYIIWYNLAASGIVSQVP